MSDLAKRRCVPCEGSTPRLDRAHADQLMGQLKPGWRVASDGQKLEKRFVFGDFKTAMSFVNKLATLAEEEQHHPDFAVHYSMVDVTLYTHAIEGLSDNDFILAAKIDEVTGKGAPRHPGRL
jgi:4a-hydroxytetrahydrobiopterin dehydratase